MTTSAINAIFLVFWYVLCASVYNCLKYKSKEIIKGLSNMNNIAHVKKQLKVVRFYWKATYLSKKLYI